jgi:hypothetical protein
MMGPVTFVVMEAEAPELARQVRERFDATGLSLVATLRSDGWPRISPVEPLRWVDNRGCLAKQAELVPGGDRGPDDPAAGAAHHVQAGRFDGGRGRR